MRHAGDLQTLQFRVLGPGSVYSFPPCHSLLSMTLSRHAHRSPGCAARRRDCERKARMTSPTFSPDGLSGGPSPRGFGYHDRIAEAARLIEARNGTWDGISAEAVARMRLQNRSLTGLDIARHTAAMMRRDMADYDRDPTQYTQSLGAWHGFVAQQEMLSVKKHFGSLKRRYIYLS